MRVKGYENHPYLPDKEAKYVVQSHRAQKGGSSIQNHVETLRLFLTKSNWLGFLT